MSSFVYLVSVAGPLVDLSMHSLMTLVAIGGVALFISVLIVLLVIFYFRYTRQRNVFRFRTLRKRVVVMHSNALYGDPLNKDQVGLIGASVLLLPRVKFEGRKPWMTTSGRVSETEYEIPLDAVWEFPRKRSDGVKWRIRQLIVYFELYLTN